MSASAQGSAPAPDELRLDAAVSASAQGSAPAPDELRLDAAVSASVDVSVVIPTRDRAAVLARCLDALAAQEVDGTVQVVVADDGSTDGTAEVLAARDSAVESFRHEHGGRSAARNRALERSRGRVVVFIDDDVVATPGLLQRHLEHHRRRPEPHEALVGLVTWSPDVEVTAHMTWLEDGGPLFAFNLIEDADAVGWRHFCTANCSVKRAFLPPAPFDEELERFVDAELGYRLAQRGMRLRYDVAAVGHHLRTDTPASTSRRMRVVGRAARAVHEKHPELREPPPAFRPLGEAKAAAARAVDPLLGRLGVHAVERRRWSYEAARAYADGYREQDARLAATRGANGADRGDP